MKDQSMKMVEIRKKFEREIREAEQLHDKIAENVKKCYRRRRSLGICNNYRY